MRYSFKLKFPAVLLLVFLAAASAWSQQMDMNADLEEDPAYLFYPRRKVIGIGVGAARYKTQWSIQDDGALPAPELTAPPEHNFKKAEVLMFLENRALFKFGPVFADVRGELRFGVYGGAEQAYLPDSMPAVISDGGFNIVGGAHFRIPWPIRATPRLTLAPFVGTGIVFSSLQASGEGLDTRYSRGSYEDRSYKVGWNEFAISMPFGAGLNIDFFRGVSITPEFRYHPFGRVSSDLQGSPVIKSSGMTFMTVLVTLGFRTL